ncbi:MAG: FtsQ-type POTRA domain-containing protein [Clostridia bacterium]|nr:FtsQ-type POTRA domain-containing protein [Clostridia bacterium]
MENKKSKIKKRKISKRSLAGKMNFKKRQKRKLFFKRSFVVIVFLAVLGAVVYGLTALISRVFCIKEIVVEGNSLYSDTEILGVSGLHQGDGMLFLNTSKSEKQLYKSFPYIDKVTIQKQFPNKVSVNIETAERTFSVWRDDVYYVFSARGKLLEKVSELPSETIELRVPEFGIDENCKINYEDDDLEELVGEIRNEFLSVGIGNIKVIDLTNKLNIVLNYDGRISIILGGKEELHYKAVTAKEILSSKINQFEKGELDLRTLSKENKSYFTPEGR